MQPLSRIKTHYQQAKDFYFKYERLLMPGTLLIGFIVDYITFTSVNIRTAFTVLIIYWLGAGLSIIFMHYYDEGLILVMREKLRYVRLFSPFLLQFFFGALLGGSFIFYWFSGSFSVSWPFIVLLVLLMVTNDFLRDYFHKPILHIGLYFFITLSLFSVILPFLFKSLSAWLFILAGLVSTLIIYGFIKILLRINTEVREKSHYIWGVVISILFVMNFFYFASLIPPIPLAIREAGIYHHIDRVGTDYILRGEQEGFLGRLIPGQTIHVRPGARVYAYSAIFAPADLSTIIWHEWQYFDEERDIWIETARSSFIVTGGRSGGFRGYTWKSNLGEGKWRVSVETSRGQVLGRIGFRIDHMTDPVQMQEVRR